MTQIKKILDKQGDEVFIRTSTKAVVDENGYTAESRLQAMQDEINAAQLEIGAVPSDLTPTEGSTNWVTSGGVFSFQPIKIVEETIDTTNMTKTSCSLGKNKFWINNNGCNHVVIPCQEGDKFIIQVTSTEASGGFTGWLTSSYTTPSAGYATPYVSGKDRVWRDKNTTVTITAPSTAAYLCLVTKDGDGHECTWTGTKREYIKLIDIINTKVDNDTLDETKTELESEIELSKYSLTTFSDVWSTNDSSVIYATKNGENTVVTVVSKKGLKRCGFDISQLAVGDRIYIDFTSEITISFGVGETLSSTYIQVKSTKKSFYFTKTSSTYNYLYIPANSYEAGTVLTLVGFKVYKAVDIDYVNEKLNKIDSYAFMPSSYIPIKEGYENYMSVAASGSGQGSAIYGNFFVQGFTYANRVIKIYNLETKSLVQEVSLPTFANTSYHTNTMSFSGTKYDNTDDFPLLYICSGYTDSSSVSTSEVYVVRIVGTSGNYTTSLIQTIYLDFGSWTEFVCDPIKNRAWINGSGIATYICIDLPSISNSEVTIDSSTTIIDKFNRKSFALGTSTTSSGQGRFFYHNRIYWVSGVPSYTGEGDEALYVCVDNTLTHCTEAVVPLKNFGLASGTSNTYEPESCFIWNDDFYVAYRTFIAKIIQN